MLETDRKIYKGMKTIYLIGGSGFLGKNLVLYLDRKYNVIVFDKYIDSEFFVKYPSVKTIQLDLVENKIPDNFKTPDFIINLASIVTAERNLALFDGLISSNLKILLNLYERFCGDKSLKLFIQFGSSEEYGSDNSPFSETMRENPNSPYALVKQLTTNTALMLYQNYRFPTMVVRPGNLFGPMQHKSKFIPYILEQLKNNCQLNVSPCEQKRDFIHTEDFAWAISGLLNNYLKCVGEIVNVSSGESISLKEIIQFCKDELKSVSVINYGAIPYRANEMMDLRCSISKLSDILDIPVKLNMKDRLKNLIAANNK